MFIVHMNQSRKPTLHFFFLLYVKELCPVNHSDFDWFQLLHDIFTKHMLLLSWFPHFDPMFLRSCVLVLVCIMFYYLRSLL